MRIHFGLTFGAANLALLLAFGLLTATAVAQDAPADPALDAEADAPADETPLEGTDVEEAGEEADAVEEEVTLEEEVPVEEVEVAPVAEEPTPELATPTPEEEPTEAEALADPAVETAVEATTDVEAAEDGEATEEAAERPLWGVTGELGTSLGLGTFVNNEYARNPYLDWSLGIIPRLNIDDRSALTARFTLSQELTRSDSDTSAQRVLASDLWFNISRNVYTIPVVEVDVAAALRLYLPTSLSSQHAGLFFAARATASLSRTFGPVTLGYIFRFRKNFHQYTTPTVDSTDTEILARTGGNELVGGDLVATGRNNVSHTFSNYLSVSVAPWDFLSFSLTYGINNSFTYNSFPVDDLSSEHASEGAGQRDVSEGVIDVSWSINERFGLSGGIYTAAAPKSSDTSSFRFPFFDFESEANNLTTFYLTFSASMDAHDLENL